MSEVEELALGSVNPAIVRVEFLGVARLRTTTVGRTVQADSVGAVFDALAGDFPELFESDAQPPRLAAGYIANINGLKFTQARSDALSDGDHLLILSADAGG